MSDIEWNRDPAASGWRSRAFVGGMWELIAYDDGGWEVRGPPLGCALVGGEAINGTAAKRAVIAAWKGSRKTVAGE